MAEFKSKKATELVELSKEVEAELASLEKLPTYSKSEYSSLLRPKEAELRRALQDEYANQITKLKNELTNQRERGKLEAKAKFEEKRAADESLLKAKKELELDKIRVSERARVDIEKSKADFEASESSETAVNAEKEILNLRDKLQGQLEEAKETLEEQLADELQDYKLELEKSKKDEMERINEKIERDFETEKTKANLEKNKKAIELLSEKERRENKIKEEYAKAKAEIEREYENKTKAELVDLLDDNTRKPLELKTKAKMNRLQQELKSDLSAFNAMLRKEEREWEQQMKKQLTEEKLDYEAMVNERVEKMDIEADSSAASTQAINEEIAKIKKEAEFIEGLADQKASELYSLQKHNRDLKKELDRLSREFHEEGRMDQFDFDINKLREELQHKEDEIRRLSELKYEPTIPLITTVGPKEELLRLANDIQEIKQIVMQSKKRPRTAERRRTRQSEINYRRDLTTLDVPVIEHAKYRRSYKPEKIQKEIAAEIARAEAKLREIELFIANEKVELNSTKKHSASDYEVLSKLLRTLEKSRREWRQELHKSRANAPRCTVLESVKEKLDSQAQMLTKQIDGVKTQMLLNEKKVSVLRMLENRSKACQSAKGSPEFVHLVTNLQKEYEAYTKKYKYSLGNDENANLYNIPSLSNLGESANDQMLYEMGALLSPHPLVAPTFDPTKEYVEPTANRRRGKSLHNVYKNVANYQDVVKRMCQRDIVKLAQGRVNAPEMFKDEANWLYRMKTEVAKTSYGFTKKFQYILSCCQYKVCCYYNKLVQIITAIKFKR
eukprot:TRINITY_DN9238_c0_g1_i1.p3 TRINITY_DN9238_c0_g1~~TRINITY_DN9238_c0_g1_i1.p3  ORF type:complete len:788 (-),score=142.12 TRINITY_DN9238_c0_g1_i1:2076-4439(-)